MELGRKLKQARLEQGLSQRQLCGDVITRNMLSLIENGSASPSMDTLRYLAGQLGKTVGYFLDEDAVSSPNQSVMECARAAFDQAQYDAVLQNLEQYQRPDPIFDREEALLRALALLELAQEAISRENRKINRAFAAGAAALGCGIRLRDEHGYAPRLNDKGMQALFAQASADFFPPEKISVMKGWSGGCSDLGDVCCVMPAVHPNIEGCTGAAHSSEFYISDPYTACVVSAKIQLGVAALLLENGCKNASDILQKAGNYPTIPEYLTAIDQNCFQGSGVTYCDDGTVELKFSN